MDPVITVQLSFVSDTHTTTTIYKLAVIVRSFIRTCVFPFSSSVLKLSLLPLVAYCRESCEARLVRPIAEPGRKDIDRETEADRLTDSFKVLCRQTER